MERLQLIELKRLYTYMVEFQYGQHIIPVPKDCKKKKDWFNLIKSILEKKDIVDPEDQNRYISRLFDIIKWLGKYRISIRFKMANGPTFFKIMTTTFVRRLTGRDLYLEDCERNSFNVNLDDFFLPDSIMRVFNRNPNNLDRRYFYTNNREQRRERLTLDEVYEVYKVQLEQRKIEAENRRKLENSILDELTVEILDIENELNLKHGTYSPLITLGLGKRHRRQQQQKIVDEKVTKETCALECKVCFNNKICVALPKCGHTFCYACTLQIDNKCAICRTAFNKDDIIQIRV